MNSKNWTKLQHLELVKGDEFKRESGSPWYMKLMLVIFSVVAMMLLVYLLSPIVKPNVYFGFFLGLGLLITSYAMYVFDKSGIFEHLATALALTGEFLIIASIDTTFKFDPWILYLFIALVQFLLLLFMPNFILKVISATFFTFALFTLFSIFGYFYVYVMLLTFVTIELWLSEFKYINHIMMVRALAYGHLFLAIYLASVSYHGEFVEHKAESLEFLRQIEWIDVSYTVGLFYLIWRLVDGTSRLNIKFNISILLSLFLLGFLSFLTHGITFGILFIILGFAVYNKIIIAFGMVFFALPIFKYYYMFGATLMDKAKLLLLVGVLLLVVRWIFLKSRKEFSHE